MKLHKRMVRGGLGLVVAGVLSAAQPLRADEDGARSDAAIRRDAERAILGYAYYGVFDAVGVDVKDGAVTLAGSVLEPYRRDELERRVAKVAGVRSLDNEIEVQPVSFNDDRLRAQLVRAIYGGRVLVNASFVDPPVRIVVANGRITLLGYVNSEVERQQIGHIARSTLAFGVDNQVKLESERVKPDRASD